MRCQDCRKFTFGDICTRCRRKRTKTNNFYETKSKRKDVVDTHSLDVKYLLKKVFVIAICLAFFTVLVKVGVPLLKGETPVDMITKEGNETGLGKQIKDLESQLKSITSETSRDNKNALDTSHAEVPNTKNGVMTQPTGDRLLQYMPLISSYSVETQKVYNLHKNGNYINLEELDTLIVGVTELKTKIRNEKRKDVNYYSQDLYYAMLKHLTEEGNFLLSISTSDTKVDSKKSYGRVRMSYEDVMYYADKTH